MRRSITTLGFVFLFALFSVANVPSEAFAAEGAPYSEQELRSYAFANASIRLIQGQLDRQLLDVQGNAQAAQELRTAAQEQKNAAIERAGLGAAEYEAMTQVIASDEELTATLQEYVFEEMGVIAGD
jgi:hypothetical protein